MRGLAAHELLEIWDQGQGLSPYGRAMLLVASACPEYTRQQVDSFSMGERDTLLAQIRARTFGRDVSTVVTCPACHEQVGVRLDVGEIFPQMSETAPSQRRDRPPLEIRSREFIVQAALPVVRDVEEIASSAGSAQGVRMLLRRCILYAECRGEPCAVDDLPEDVCALIDSRMAEADPQGDVRLALQCPGCEHRWSMLFDILSFLWGEIQICTRRLLREVHALASAYGWTESEILTLSTTRRNAYLEMVGG